ncbi:Rieske (2Fe-2S) protein [Streptantibioticus parmotrematis]|uniref:Rieske (2Fe-2S) protein n=1 Tax=Streptantibioticus parmotrematis TaxID=2873249 RepID=UPI00340BDE45
MTDQPTARRTVLQGAAVVGVAGVGLSVAGCAAKPKQPSGPVDLGAADEVPVGGAKLYRDQKVVVAQPTKGAYKGFSAVCTHQGCVVASIQNNVVTCPCHGSQFNALTGAVEQGPAPTPLPAVGVTVQNGKLVADS